MNRITVFAATAVGGLGAALCGGAIRAIAGTTPVTTAASDLSTDIQAGHTGPTATANDQDTAAQFNVDDGQVNNVEEQTGQSGDQQTGESSAAQSGDQG